MTKRQRQLAEAIEMANLYWPYKHFGPYWYSQWEKAEIHLDNLLSRGFAGPLVTRRTGTRKGRKSRAKPWCRNTNERRQY